MSNFVSEKSHIGGLNCSYRSWGHGSNIILILHGWGASSLSWENTVRYLNPQEIRVYIPDLPGFGGSESPKVPWSVEDYANWTLRFMKNIGISSPTVIAHSFGGRIAILLSNRDKDWAKKLIFCAAAGIKHQLSPKAGLIKSIAKFTRHLPIPHSLKKVLYRFAGATDYLKTSGVMRDTFKKVISLDLTTYLQGIEIPVHIIWGDRDTYLPVEDAKIMQRKIRGSTIKIVTGGNHSLHLQRPAFLANHLSQQFS